MVEIEILRGVDDGDGVRKGREKGRGWWRGGMGGGRWIVNGMLWLRDEGGEKEVEGICNVWEG